MESDYRKQVSSFRQNQRNQRNAKKTDLYVDKLRKSIERSMRTIFIGAIDTLEKKAAFLKDEYPDLWDEIRTEILDKGNAQIRVINKELNEHDISIEGRKTYQLRPRRNYNQ